MQKCNRETVLFLTLLTSEIYHRLKYVVRETGEPWAAEKTLGQGEDSCRDFVVLFIEACRHVGMAARFVSGYIVGDINEVNNLHAWGEVYLTGAGWLGFDPTHGLAVNEQYVALAAGQNFRSASPIDGSFRGGALSTMETAVLVAEA